MWDDYFFILMISTCTVCKNLIESH